MRLEALRAVPPLPIDEPEQFHAPCRHIGTDCIAFGKFVTLM